MDLPTITIPPTAPHTHTLIFLHGRGDTSANFSRSLLHSHSSHQQTLFASLPSFRFVFPSALPIPSHDLHRDQLISQWFDIYNVSNFSDHEELQAEGLRESVRRVRGLIEREVEGLGGEWGRVVLAGISQGGAVGVHTLLHLPEPIGAFLGFSCRMPFPGRGLCETRGVLGLDGVQGEGNEVVRGTPVLLEHCGDDPLVLVEWGRGLRESLRGFGAGVSWREYEGGGHWFNSPRGMDDVISFLNERVLKRESVGGNVGEDVEMDLS